MILLECDENKHDCRHQMETSWWVDYQKQPDGTYMRPLVLKCSKCGKMIRAIEIKETPSDVATDPDSKSA